MTQEQIVRGMLQAFAEDRPDGDFQEGFLAALIVVATEVLGFDIEDIDVICANSAANCTLNELCQTKKKARLVELKVIDGSKPAPYTPT